MLDLVAMATFVAVVRSRHFTAAAHSLGIPKSTVSQHVSRLEQALGVRLLERTTRTLRPTHAGAAYYERCARIIAEVEEANAAVKDSGASPRGVLRVATSHLLGQAVLAAVAAKFTKRYPEVEVEIVAVDRRVRLLEEGFDVAIVVSATEIDSTMIARVLSAGKNWCCASPSYLRSHGTPSAPKDLSAHDCIIRDATAEGFARGATWSFARGREVQRFEARGRLRVNSIMMAHAAAMAGAGIAILPSFICTENIRKRQLVRLLSQWTVDPKDIRIIYPSNRHLSPRIRLFVDALVRDYQGRFGSGH